jgi:Tol biopolymer transport system component
MLSIVAIRWRAVPFLRPRSELQEIQLTTNSSENPVSAAAISPDGKYLAYSDLTGLHLRLIDSGETNTVEIPGAGEINRVLWFPDGSKLIVSGEGADKGARPAIWSASIVGGSPRKLAQDGLEASVSPDGSQIAFVDVDRKHISIMGANGEDPHHVLSGSAEETFYLPHLAGDGRLGFGRVRSSTDGSGNIKSEVSAEWRDREGLITVALSHPGLTGGIGLPNGRWLYSVVAEPGLNRDASLWEARSNHLTGQLSAQQKMRDWPGNVSLWEFTASADGKRVAYMKRTLQKDVYVADLRSRGDLANARRFTLDDSEDFVTNWTPDSKAILFASDRNGTYDIFEQSLDQRTPEAVVVGPDDERGPTAVSPDGAWFYYFVRPKEWRSTTARGMTIMRTPASGGARQKVADDSQRHMALCARSPSTTCVLVEEDGAQLEVYALDTLQGKGRKIIGTELGSSQAYWLADLSPDGSSVALLLPNQKRVRILPLQGGVPRDVTIADRQLDLAPFYWSVDGAGWYVSSTSAVYPAGTNLLHIDLNGHATVVWHLNVRDWTSGIPSPDGRHLAFTHSSNVSNVWMLKDF